eukprot:gene29574-5926_t
MLQTSEIRLVSGGAGTLLRDFDPSYPSYSPAALCDIFGPSNSQVTDSAVIFRLHFNS